MNECCKYEVNRALEMADKICDDEGSEWDSEKVHIEKNYAHFCRDAIRALIDQPEPQTVQQNEPVALDREDFLRISKSGYSVKVGWNTEKRIIAKSPYAFNDMEGFKQWMEDADRLCDGWNRTFQPTQPQAGTASVSQELMDYVDRLEMALTDLRIFAGHIGSSYITNVAEQALQSKPAKG